MYFFLKVAISALVIATVSEVAKRSLPLAAILASLPLTSVLALLWFYLDTGNTPAVGQLASQIFWALLPSLLFFLLFPWLLRTGLAFYPALLLALSGMACGYLIYAQLLEKLGISIG